MDSVLTIVIPAFNERSSLETNLPLWLEACRQRGWRLIVVDDGSQDGSEEVIRAYAGEPILAAYRHRANRGYGSALKTGLYHADTPFVVTMDADGQHQIEDVDRLLDAMTTRDADLAIGARVINRTSGVYRRLGKALIRLVARILFGARLRDLNSGFKLYRTEVVSRLLPWCPDSMAFSDVVALLHLNLGLQVVEVPVLVRPRHTGRSTINTMTAVDTVVEIVNVLMWFRPLKIFLPAGVLLVVTGVGWAIPLLLAGRGLSSASLLLTLGGMMVGVVGLLAEQLAQLRRVDLPDVATRRILPR